MKKILVVVQIFVFVNLALSQENGMFTNYVDPFIGTKGGGNTFPGISLPFGMVKLGPDCGKKLANSGYIPDSPIHGFSHLHVSGTGGGAKYGNILLMPFTGDFPTEGIFSEPKNYAAAPGYFSIDLVRYQIHSELTCSQSVGFHQYAFPENNNKGILIDAGSFLGEGHCCGEAQELVGSEIKIVSETRIKGYSRVRGGWNKSGEISLITHGNKSCLHQ